MTLSLVDLLFKGYRQRVLGLLLLHPDKRYHVREIARLTGTVAGTLHKELKRLEEAGILVKESIGNQIHYYANRQCPVYEELASILRKTSGVVDVLADALLPISTGIEVALVYGSIASGKAVSSSDVDVLIIGELDFKQVVKLLQPVEEILAREVNPEIFTRKEWQQLKKKKAAFYKEVKENPKLFVIGVEHELG